MREKEMEILRKSVWLLLLAGVLLLGACGHGEWEGSCEKAARLVADWDAAELNCYRYEGSAGEQAGERYYLIIMRPGQGAAGQPLSVEQVTHCVQSMTPDLLACFEGQQLTVIFEVYDEAGALQCAFVNGEQMP